MSEPQSVAARLAGVRERIERATRACNRHPSSVTLIAVSKGHSPESIVEAYRAGQRDFGESYVQELQRKAGALAQLSDIKVHLIGHLQRNKAKLAVQYAHVVHTIDTPQLASELARRQAALGPARLPVLVEVNVGGEAQKHGVTPAGLGNLISAVRGLPELDLRGLMTIPPHSDDPAQARPHFEALRALQQVHGGVQTLPELSMGMSDDLEVAIAAGATLVRVGTAIFGARQPH